MASIGRFAASARQVMRVRAVAHYASHSHGTSAVHAMCDSKDEWLDEDAQRRRKRSEPVIDSEGSASGRGVQWVVIGEPGANKHVYASRLSKLLRVPHISIRSLVRQELSPRSDIYKQHLEVRYAPICLYQYYAFLPVILIFGTPFGDISNALYQGQAVPEDVVFGLLSKRLEDDQYRGESGFILDGIPRSRRQAGILDEIADIDLVISFKFKYKLLGNSLISPPSGGHSIQVKEMEDYYKKQKKLLSFQVAGGASAETWQGLVDALCLKHMDAAPSSALSSPKLTI